MATDTAAKLTPAQRTALQAASDGILFRSERTGISRSSSALYKPYRGDNARVTAAVVSALSDRGLITLDKGGKPDSIDSVWKITDSGRAALAPRETFADRVDATMDRLRNGSW